MVSMLRRTVETRDYNDTIVAPTRKLKLQWKFPEVEEESPSYFSKPSASIRSVLKNRSQLDGTSKEIQTDLMVYPHYLKPLETARVTRNMKSQTSCTLMPQAKLDVIIPELRTPRVHCTTPTDGHYTPIGFVEETVEEFIRSVDLNLEEYDDDVVQWDEIHPTVSLMDVTSVVLNCDTPSDEQSDSTIAKKKIKREDIVLSLSDILNKESIHSKGTPESPIEVTLSSRQIASAKNVSNHFRKAVDYFLMADQSTDVKEMVSAFVSAFRVAMNDDRTILSDINNFAETLTNMLPGNQTTNASHIDENLLGVFLTACLDVVMCRGRDTIYDDKDKISQDIAQRIVDVVERDGTVTTPQFKIDLSTETLDALTQWRSSQYWSEHFSECLLLVLLSTVADGTDLEISEIRSEKFVNSILATALCSLATAAGFIPDDTATDVELGVQIFRSALDGMALPRDSADATRPMDRISFDLPTVSNVVKDSTAGVSAAATDYRYPPDCTDFRLECGTFELMVSYKDVRDGTQLTLQVFGPDGTVFDAGAMSSSQEIRVEVQQPNMRGVTIIPFRLVKKPGSYDGKLTTLSSAKAIPDNLPCLAKEPVGYVEPYMRRLLELEAGENSKKPVDDGLGYLLCRHDAAYVETYITDMSRCLWESEECQTDLTLGDLMESTSLSSLLREDTDEYETCSEGPNSARTIELPWKSLTLTNKEFVPAVDTTQAEKSDDFYDAEKSSDESKENSQDESLPATMEQKASSLALLFRAAAVSTPEDYAMSLIPPERKDSGGWNTDVSWKSFALPPNLEIRKIHRLNIRTPCPWESNKIFSIMDPRSNASCAYPDVIHDLSTTKVKAAVSEKIELVPKVADLPYERTVSKGRVGCGKMTALGQKSTVSDSALLTVNTDETPKTEINCMKELAMPVTDVLTTKKETILPEVPAAVHVPVSGPVPLPLTVPVPEKKSVKNAADSEVEIEASSCRAATSSICTMCNRALQKDKMSTFKKVAHTLSLASETVSGSATALPCQWQVGYTFSRPFVDPVELAVVACQNELRPIREAIDLIRQKLHTINIPELNRLLRTPSLGFSSSAIFNSGTGGARTESHLATKNKKVFTHYQKDDSVFQDGSSGSSTGYESRNNSWARYGLPSATKGLDLRTTSSAATSVDCDCSSIAGHGMRCPFLQAINQMLEGGGRTTVMGGGTLGIDDKKMKIHVCLRRERKGL